MQGGVLAAGGHLRRAPWTATDALDRAVLIAFSLLLFGIGAVHRLLAAPNAGAVGPSPLEIGAGEILAATALVKIVLADRTRPLALGTADLMVLAAASLVWLVPHQNIPFIAFTAAGLYLAARRREHPVLLSTAQVWLAVSGYELWGRSIFKLTSSVIIEGETRVLASVGRLFYPGLRQDGIRLVASPDWFIFVLEGCSAFHNISLAVLVWVCVVKLAEGRFGRRVFGALALGLAGVFGLNVVRILLMVPAREPYLFWHEGLGATLFSVLTLAAVAVPTLHALRRSAR